jgi:sugar O-acyltransferase (sialic acid O-acetyltransferase NeuD family)
VKRVIIIGNSGAARECYWLLSDMLRERADASFRGFLAFEGFAGDLRDLADFALGSDDAYLPCAEDVFVIGIGLPALRRKAFGKWKDRGARFFTLVHPTVHLAENAVLGEGNILASGTYISCDAALGNANYLNGFMIVGHDARIGDYNFFGTCTQVLGGAGIGDGNSLGVSSVLMPGAKIGDNNTIAPGAFVYKGCGDNRIMAGNPALDVS